MIESRISHALSFPQTEGSFLIPVQCSPFTKESRRHGQPHWIALIVLLVGTSPGGGESVLGISPFGPARAKTPVEATKTITEVSKPVRKKTKKHVRAAGAHLTI